MASPDNSRLANDRDPFVAAKAREILKTIEANEKK